MTTLILVRHGESYGNLTHTFCGHTDVLLTDRGRAQAECTAKYLDRYPIDLIYASDLKRTLATAEPTAKRRGLPVLPSRNLREINAGLWEGLPFEQVRERYPESYQAWCGDIGVSECNGGESVAGLQERINGELRRIVAENRGKTVAVFTHATPIRTMGCLYKGFPVSEMQTACDWPSNASVTVVTYDDEGKGTLVCYGENCFLSESGFENLDI